MVSKPAHLDLLDPMAVNQLGTLEIIATRIVEGFVSGKHRSPYKGCSIEFAEHRAYTPGDEMRMLDWRVLARSDRYYIKQYEEETNLKSLMVIDASGSMGFGLSTVTKFRYAQMAAACLARMMLHQRDAVGAVIFDTGIRHFIPPRSRANHLDVILEQLSATTTGGETSLAAVIHQLPQQIKSRGMLMIFSDCFDDVESLLTALKLLRARGHEVILFHIMAPEELSFDFRKWTRFQSLEVAGQRVDLDPATIRKGYIERVNVFLERLRLGCGEAGCDYVPLTTDQPLGDTLAQYLARRSARMGGSRR
jgi:uncharacterized protein (DUF58 family)